MLVMSMSVFTSALAAESTIADVERGRLLYENHCTVCHESTVHVREDRRVGNRAEIMAMISRFSTHLELGWSAEEMLDVLEYLDQQYYRIGGGAM